MPVAAPGDHSKTVVLEPTRENNTLDVFIIHNPTIKNRWEIAPDVSDHDIVFAEVDMKPRKNIQKQRIIPLYKKADWAGYQRYMEELRLGS